MLPAIVPLRCLLEHLNGNQQLQARVVLSLKLKKELAQKMLSMPGFLQIPLPVDRTTSIV